MQSRRRKESHDVWSQEEDGSDSTVHTHTDDCKILKADPDVEIPWNEVEAGHWRAECVCTVEYYNEPFVDDRVRLDPLDPATFRHLGQCEFASETDAAMLKVTDKGEYGWIECGSCGAGWQVPHYAAASVG